LANSNLFKNQIFKITLSISSHIRYDASGLPDKISILICNMPARMIDFNVLYKWEVHVGSRVPLKDKTLVKKVDNVLSLKGSQSDKGWLREIAEIVHDALMQFS
jgi:hypothetical protein